MKEILNSTTKLALILTLLAVILLTAFKVEVTEPLKTVSLMIVSFYFGQKATETKQ